MVRIISCIFGMAVVINSWLVIDFIPYIGTASIPVCKFAVAIAPGGLIVALVVPIWYPFPPYNTLLLFHGLGSGKTCSAIGVTEEMRDYMKFVAISKKKDLEVATQANETVKICEGYAYAAFPEVYDRIANCDSSIPAQTRIEDLIKEISS